MEEEGIDGLGAALKLNVGRWHEDLYQMARHHVLARLALGEPIYTFNSKPCLSIPICRVMCQVAVEIEMLCPSFSCIDVILGHGNHVGHGNVSLGGGMPTLSEYWIALEKAAISLSVFSDEFRFSVEHHIWRNKSVSDD
jgi:hypothetical protein